MGRAVALPDEPALGAMHWITERELLRTRADLLESEYEREALIDAS